MALSDYFLLFERSLQELTSHGGWWLNVVFTHLCIQIVTVRLYWQNLIYKHITHHHTLEKSGTINKYIAYTELIRRAVTEFNWDRVFLNTNANEKVSVFSSIIMNILSNFIPHETIVCEDKESPCFNKTIKFLIEEKKTNSKNTAKVKITSNYHNV